MCKSSTYSGHSSQNRNIPLVCPLDIQGSCDSSVFGDIVRNSESNTNLGLINVTWGWQLEGSSLLLGMLIGSVLTIIISILIKHIRRRKRSGGWPKPFQHFNHW